MTQLAYQRFTITVPDNMARQIDQVCAVEGRNRSELFREAVRLYFASGALAGAAPMRGLSNTQRAPQAEDALRLFWPEYGTSPAQQQDRQAAENERIACWSNGQKRSKPNPTSQRCAQSVMR